MTVRLQFSAQSDLESDLIEFYDHGLWSHVDAVMNDGHLLGARSDVIGGIPAGVQIRPPGYATWKRIEAVHLVMDCDMEAHFWGFLHGQIGKPYDVKAILGLACQRDWHDPSAWFCSELVGAALETCSFFKFYLSTPTNRLTPDGLLLALSAVTPINGA